jgi:uncharacterized Fe-S radical SAM superfamily protein PflX
LILSKPGLIDVYLPDFKYISDFASRFSDAEIYPTLPNKQGRWTAKGSTVVLNGGHAETGMIIRHFVWPNG